jgi:hypothetical protein
MCGGMERPRHPARIAAERYARLVAAAAALAILAGVVVLVLGGIALVSVVFLLIGAGEERDRERHPGG